MFRGSKPYWGLGNLPKLLPWFLVRLGQDGGTTRGGIVNVNVNVNVKVL